MRRYFILAATFLLLSSATVEPAAGQGMAEAAPLSSEKVSEELLKQNLVDFNKWRREIPDYEKRLYDRVKALNSKSLRLLRVVIAGFIILLILNGIMLYLILSGRGFNGSNDGASRTPKVSLLQKMETWAEGPEKPQTKRQKVVRWVIIQTIALVVVVLVFVALGIWG